MSEREPITAELRELMGGVEPRVDEDGVVTAKYVTPEAWGEFVRRCDAIDAVHAGLERENEELRERVAVLDNERGNMHDGWVRLPLDADGVPIRVGDVMDFSKNVRNLTVLGVGTVDGGCSWGVFVREGDDYVWYNARFLRHHHAPTVEDVLTKFGIDWEYEDNCEDRAALLAEYAAKLRLAGDAE